MWLPGLWDLFWKPSFPTKNKSDLSKAQGSDRQEGEGRKCVSPIPTSLISYKICMKAFKKVFLNNTVFFFNLGGISLNNNMKKVDWRMAVSLHALTFETELRKPETKAETTISYCQDFIYSWQPTCVFWVTLSLTVKTRSKLEIKLSIS